MNCCKRRCLDYLPSACRPPPRPQFVPFGGKSTEVFFSASYPVFPFPVSGHHSMIFVAAARVMYSINLVVACRVLQT